jgi:lipopolysaccharide/colanic/teichoic acid biosynthesis glycosyltransferase
LRFSVQPGLTGWAQAHNIYAVPDGAQALEFDLFYVQNMSLFLDILSLIKTIKCVFSVQGK